MTYRHDQENEINFKLRDKRKKLPINYIKLSRGRKIISQSMTRYILMVRALKSLTLLFMLMYKVKPFESEMEESTEYPKRPENFLSDHKIMDP